MHPHTSLQYKALLNVPYKWRGRHITGGRQVKRKQYCVPQWHNIYTKVCSQVPNGLEAETGLLTEAQTQVHTNKMIITET
jgi:hypothetical protein